ATSSGLVQPPVVPPSGGRAVGSLAVQSPTALPSGTVVQAAITETFQLVSGETASEEQRLEDVVLYRLPAPEGAALAAAFPIVPSRSSDAAEVRQGKVHLDILAGRESVRGTTGGTEAVVVEAGDARLAVPAQALSENVAVDLEAVSLSDFLPQDTSLVPLAE